MTSKRSSVDVFRISFVQTLQRFWYHGAALLLLLTPMFGDLHDLFRHRFYYEYEFYENNILELKTSNIGVQQWVMFII